MKRWILGIALAVLLLGAAIVSLVWWRPGYLFLATATTSPEFAAKWMVNWRERMAKSAPGQQKRNLESEVIRIELEGRRYDVPMRYSYGQAIEKHGRWPTAKPERVKVGALTLSVRLPDMKPYYLEDDARWKVRGHGDRLEVTIAKPVGSLEWFQYFRNGYLRGEDKLATRMPDANGLARFAYRKMEDVYFPINGDLELVISCDPEPASSDFSPGCRTKSNYKEGIVLEYSYGRNYFEHWREIDSVLKTMFDGFEQAANAEFKGQGK